MGYWSQDFRVDPTTGGLVDWGGWIEGRLGELVDYGISQLPARRPPSLPPAKVPPSLPPAGVPYPRGGGGVPGPRPGRGMPGISAAARAAIIAAGGYEIGKLLYDAAGNLLGRAHKRRRMNVLNPRALRRSMRRVYGFAHFAKRTITFTHRVRMKKRGRFGRK